MKFNNITKGAVQSALVPKPRKASEALSVLKQIDLTAIRDDFDYNKGTGCFNSAEFQVRNKNGEPITYKALACGILKKRVETKNGGYYWQQLKAKPSKNFRYNMFKVGTAHIATYHVILTALNPDFYGIYSKNKDICVNHCVMQSIHKDALRRFHKNAPGTDCDVRYLEICTLAENNRHAKFVYKWDLEGLYIRARDVETLHDMIVALPEKKRTTRNVRKIVKDYYKGYSFKTKFKRYYA